LQGLVNAVVHDLVDELVKALLIGPTDIHSRPTSDTLKSF
jgi:hypothetical protein